MLSGVRCRRQRAASAAESACSSHGRHTGTVTPLSSRFAHYAGLVRGAAVGAVFPRPLRRTGDLGQACSLQPTSGSLPAILACMGCRDGGAFGASSLLSLPRRCGSMQPHSHVPHAEPLRVGLPDWQFLLRQPGTVKLATVPFRLRKGHLAAMCGLGDYPTARPDWCPGFLSAATGRPPANFPL